MAYTEREQIIINLGKQYMPAKFLANLGNDADARILAFALLVLSDINFIPPMTAWTFEDCPVGILPILAFGLQYFATMFLQANYSLNDFSYSDASLTLSIDRVGKMSPVLQSLMQQYTNMAKNIKTSMTLKIAGKPRPLMTRSYTSLISNYLGALYPGTSNYMQ